MRGSDDVFRWLYRKLTRHLKFQNTFTNRLSSVYARKPSQSTFPFGHNSLEIFKETREPAFLLVTKLPTNIPADHKEQLKFPNNPVSHKP
jgi:hypothetical protein